MKKADVKVGGLYTAKVSGKVVTVRVDGIRGVASTRGGSRGGDRYDVTNLTTGRKTVFRSAAKFREEVKQNARTPRQKKELEANLGDIANAARNGRMTLEQHDQAHANLVGAEQRPDPTPASSAAGGSSTRSSVTTAEGDDRPDPTPASATPPASSPAGAGAPTAAASPPSSGPAAPASTTRNGSSVADPKRRRTSLEALGGQYRSPPVNDGGKATAADPDGVDYGPFTAAWAGLAAKGACDGLGGAEYRRVSREWAEAGADPRGVAEFISKRANAGSTAPVTGGLAALAAELAPKPEDCPPPHVIVKACAGTGKTTTLVQGVKGVMGQDPTQMTVTESGGHKKQVTITPSPQQRAVWDSLMLSAGRNETVCFVAFNKPIAEHLKTVVPPGCDAMTMHSMGFKAVRRAFPRVRVNEYRTEDLIAGVLQRDIRELRRTIGPTVSLAKRLVELCKMNLVGVPAPGQFAEPEGGWRPALDDLVSYYELDTEGARQEEAYELAVVVLDASRNPDADGCIEFGDMIWLPVVLGLPVYRYGLLLVDESQDLGRCQQALALMAGRRLVLCGDPRQAIYGFAGADTTSMARMRDLLAADPRGCVELPLTVTRRCGKAIVEEARAIVPEFEAHESNGDGLVTRAAYPTMKDRPELPWEQTYCASVKPGDMVVCRCNAPLVGQCFRFIKKGIKANIQGRDVGQGLISTISKMKADSVPALVGKLNDWLHAETGKENAKRNPSEGKLIMLSDRYDCVVAFCEGAATVDEVIDRINKVFTDDRDAPGVRFSSIHRAKGLEANRVFFLMPEGASCPHPMAKSDWQVEQERHLLYVGITRAITELVFVS